jgi:hypothetical protein
MTWRIETPQDLVTLAKSDLQTFWLCTATR